LGEPSAVGRRPENIRVESEDAFNLLDKLVELLLAPARVGREVYGRSLNWQRRKHSGNSLWRRRLGESIQQLAASMLSLACDQAAQLLNFRQLLDALSDKTNVLQLVVQIFENWLCNWARLNESPALLGRGLVLQCRRALQC
jgi:hypothetical protein